LLLFEAVTPRVWAVWGRLPPAGGFVRGLCKESSELSFACFEVPDITEAGEAIGSQNEGVVGVESFGRACTVVSVLQKSIEKTSSVMMKATPCCAET